MNKVFIIAEAGVNHNGDINIAKKLIEVAAEAGADAVKFQTFKTTNLVSKKAEKAHYQKETSDSKESLFEMIKKLELGKTEHLELLKYCKSKNITFLSTPFDHDSIDLLNELGLDTFKIPSGEITNLPYLQHIGSLNKYVILSTGMSNLNEIGDALDLLINSGTNKNKITVLHANTEYPTPYEDVNLLAMKTIKKQFNINVGYSDHTVGIEIPIAAVALGACIIEKHFTLDKKMIGPDHKASMEPAELRAMVEAVRIIEKALGNGIKIPSESEKKNIPIVRKSILAKCIINKGEKFTAKNLTIKRPGTGISPMRWNELIGMTANKKYNPEDLIEI